MRYEVRYDEGWYVYDNETEQSVSVIYTDSSDAYEYCGVLNE